MTANSIVANPLEPVINIAKPVVRPLLERFLFDPLIKTLLQTTTISAEFGVSHPKLRFFPPETIPTPEVKHMPPFDDPFKYLEGESYTTHDIYSSVLEDVLVEPGNGVVLTQSRKILTESLYPHMDTITMRGALLNKSFIKRKFFEKPVEKISGYSSIYQGLPNGYYHKFIDLIPRAYLLHHPDYQSIDRINLLYTEPFSETEALMVPGIIPKNAHLKFLNDGKLYQIEKLILPTFVTQFGAGYLPAPYIQKLREIFLPKRPSTREHRIYISRAKSATSLKKRHILNEEELFDALQPLGFQKYQLEDLTLQEKIELFYDAETVVGAYGGGLTHILFSEKVNVLELQVMRKTQTYYYYLAKCLGHPYCFWYSTKANNRENFTVDVEEVMNILSKWHAGS
jgi:hypothetical protein